MDDREAPLLLAVHYLQYDTLPVLSASGMHHDVHGPVSRFSAVEILISF